ncbi:MAG: phospho-N-acetylmuramoyl-pentapeptide-transferase [Clostridiales bacterium]|jgi:phospho-N-acetylmuramoyl-pentapeptide-transferase|nr:phospho-N-acetylmuramoyl-pentapeptide-transferase [Clostridiales bacterium]
MQEYGDLIVVLAAAVAAFVLSMLTAPLVIRLMARIKVGQPILKYLEGHTKKSGTPTMGGWIFILPTAVVSLLFGYGRLSLIAVLVTVGYGIVGFSDDFIKVRYKRNEGLKPYQKIIAQLGIALIAAFFAYYNEWIGDSVRIPFFTVEWNMGLWYIPFAVFLFLAVTNSVNLTDGLDGLAASSGVASVFALLVAGILYYFEAAAFGMTGLQNELFSLCIFLSALAASLLGFLWHNANPARIFMGDTGALALGGAIAAGAIFMRNPLLLAFVCIVHVWSSLSVILQVIYFKLTKKRIFKMSPFHHHLELSGYSENRISVIYAVLTVVTGAVGTIGVILSLTM